MINKVINSAEFEWDRPSVTSLKVASTGVDREQLKREGGEGGQPGGVFDHEFRDLKPIPGKTILHVLAVGDEESSGPNRNGDSFPSEANRTHHQLFKEQGHLFLDHKHKHPKLAVGEVLKTAYNKPMGRIELLLAADNNKAEKYLNKHPDGADLPVSMGCTVNQETCSVCDHVAPRAKQRCEHVKEQLGAVLKTGQQVFMRNPDPNYFDISLVWRPADRVGYTFRKVAYDLPSETSDELALQLGLTQMGAKKLAAIRRVASIEKQLGGIAQAWPDKLSARTIQTLKAKTAQHGVAPLVAALHREGYLLHPEDFLAVFCPGCKTAGVTEELQQGPGLEPLLDDQETVDDLDGEDEGIQLDEPDLKRACSMDPAPLRMRLLRSPMLSSVKVANPLEIQGAADLYRHYRAAFAAHNLHDWGRLVGCASVP